jgi:hypothetical protein
MKKAITILILALISISCSKEKNSPLYLLTKDNWTQYLEMHNGIINPLKQFDELTFKTDKSFLYTIPGIEENDTVYGSYSLVVDTIKLDTFRKILTLVEVDGQTEYHETILNVKQNWAVIELNESFLTIKIGDNNFVFINK